MIEAGRNKSHKDHAASKMSDRDEISAIMPPAPTMGATAALEDQETVPTHAPGNTETPSTESAPNKKPEIESFDVEAAEPARSRSRTSGIVLMCCVSLYAQPSIELID